MHPDFASVDVGGRDIRYLCQGAGAVTVVFDQGQGISVEEDFSRRIPFGWPMVFMEVRAATRAFTYDRAGLGWSDKAPEPRTSRDVADDLHTVLHKLELPPPYILVGHSIGGFTVQQYASSHPDEVAGLVLIDSAHPDQQARLAHLLPAPPVFPRRETLLLHCLRPNPPNPLPGGVDFETSAEQIRAAGGLGDKPVIVVSRGVAHMHAPLAQGLDAEAAATIERVWSELQADLLAISTNSSRVIADGPHHDIANRFPRLVIDAIFRMLECVSSRTSTRASLAR
jgi:pimeloyl-ACP methyl ester carboxylesterase